MSEQQQQNQQQAGPGIGSPVDHPRWKVGQHGSVIIPVDEWPDEDDSHIAHYGGYVVCESIQDAATGKLIAAAPQMRRALQHVADNPNAHPSNVQAVVRAALAEAVHDGA